MALRVLARLTRCQRNAWRASRPGCFGCRGVFFGGFAIGLVRRQFPHLRDARERCRTGKMLRESPGIPNLDVVECRNPPRSQTDTLLFTSARLPDRLTFSSAPGTLLGTRQHSAMRYVRSETVVTREVAGETIVVPVRGGVGDLNGLFTFNEIASGIWQLLAASRTADEVAAWVRERYEVSEEQARTDVDGFLEELRRQGLVHEA